tara:strand:+ start:6 stop:332 length:327 start_codon:yes stop_codon:yes gene_type:complete
VSRIRVIKKYHKKWGVWKKGKQKNKKGLSPKFQHTLENCVCGAKKHNLSRFKEWQRIQNVIIERETKREKKLLGKINIERKIQKEYRVSTTDKIGGEYKDRHKEFGKK